MALTPVGGNMLISNSPPLGLYSRTKPRALWWSLGGRLFLMMEVSLYMLRIIELPQVSRFRAKRKQLKRRGNNLREEETT